MPMDTVEVTVDEKAGSITIVMPLEPPRESRSGKTMVIASTSGNVKTDAKYKGHPITVGVNAYYKNTGDDEEAPPPAKKKASKKKEEVEDDDDDDE
jgi:hypothetical protein